MSNEYWQCSHVRKCKWVGEHKDLLDIPNNEYPGLSMTDQVCPKCLNYEFYTLNEEEYKKLKAK